MPLGKFCKVGPCLQAVKQCGDFAVGLRGVFRGRILVGESDHDVACVHLADRRFPTGHLDNVQAEAGPYRDGRHLAGLQLERRILKGPDNLSGSEIVKIPHVRFRGGILRIFHGKHAEVFSLLQQVEHVIRFLIRGSGIGG